MVSETEAPERGAGGKKMLGSGGRRDAQGVVRAGLEGGAASAIATCDPTRVSPSLSR